MHILDITNIFVPLNSLIKKKRLNKHKIMNEELLSMLDLSEQLKERIINDCHITSVTFWNWKKGNTPIPFWAKEKINLITRDIAGKEVFINCN